MSKVSALVKALGNAPAAPVVTPARIDYGLTKREYMALHIWAVMCVESVTRQPIEAVQAADMLLESLEAYGNEE